MAVAISRRVGTPGRDVAHAHLHVRLDELGLSFSSGAFSLPYEGDGYRLGNLVGLEPRAERAPSPVLIATPYEMAGNWPGANDNAAAAAIALKTARWQQPGGRCGIDEPSVRFGQSAIQIGAC